MQHTFPWLTVGRMRLRKLRGVLFVVAALLGGVAVVGGLWLSYYVSWAWAFDMKKVTAMSAASIIYDRNGYVLQRFFEENRLPVSGDQIPDILKQAIIAAEDQRFYWHFGFDPFGIIRAAFGNLLGSRVTSGASTITQQLARNSAQMFERTLDRKLKELFLAVRLETVFSKDEILVLYLNRIFFGRDIYGIGAAAQGYFGKEPKDLTLSESALLAGVISGPNSFSPWRSPERAKQVRARVLDRMVKETYITSEQAMVSKEEPLVLRPLMELPASYVVAALWDEWPEFLPRELALRGGLRVYSTVDAAFQNAAEEELEAGLQEIERMPGYHHQRRSSWLRKESLSTSPPYLQGAFVAIRNADGGILAMVGGRNYQESTFNRAVESKRQVGSTLKPFVYAHLFNAVHATAFTEIPSEKFDLHHPELAFEGTANGPFLTVRRALETSNNFCAMRAGLAAGVAGFVDLVRNATGEQIPPYPSSFLGACTISPLEMTKAYSIFPNKGVLIQPHLIDRIETADGKVLFEHEQVRRRILSPEVSFQIHHLLEGVVNNGTAQGLRSRFQLQGELAGKTGTTDDYKDGWFVGYNTAVTAGVWVGLDQPKTIIPQGYSTVVAVPLWGRIMQMADEHYPSGEFISPPEVKLARKAEERGWFLFSSTVVSGDAEYVRDEQRNDSLARVTHADMTLGEETPEQRMFFVDVKKE